jgi:protein involved in polysaccharide export with SLBB domain
MTRFLSLAAMTVVGVALQFGCAATSRRPAPPPQRALPASDVGRHDEQYKIQPGDMLAVTFAGEPDFNHQVRVDLNGRISLSYVTQGSIADFPAAGLSVSALAARITDYATENKVLVNPRVQVLVLEYATQSFVVLGQVNLPGRYTFPRGLPPRLELEEAIALAGGYTRLARQSVVLVKRGGNIHKVDLRRLSTYPGEPHFSIVPGDVITVAERIF